jgi:hypothetical protein
MMPTEQTSALIEDKEFQPRPSVVEPARTTSMTETVGYDSGRNRRRHARAPSLYSGSLHRDGASAADCVVRDISASGARVMLERLIVDNERCVLDIDGVGLFPSKIVWRRDHEAGLEFLVDPEWTRVQFNAHAGKGELPG